MGKRKELTYLQVQFDKLEGEGCKVYPPLLSLKVRSPELSLTFSVCLNHSKRNLALELENNR